MNSKKIKTKGQYYVYLLSNIVEEVNNIKTTKTNKEKMLIFLDFLKSESRMCGEKVSDKGIPDNLTNYVSVPYNLLVKMFGGVYREVLKPLIDKNIIEVNNSYSNFEGKEKCKEYRCLRRT